MKKSEFFEALYKVVRDITNKIPFNEEKQNSLVIKFARKRGLLPERLSGTAQHQIPVLIILMCQMNYRTIRPAEVLCVQRYSEKAWEYFQEVEV